MAGLFGSQSGGSFGSQDYTPSIPLPVDNLSVSPVMTSPSISFQGEIAADDLTVSPLISSPVITTEISIDPEDLTINATLSNATITIEGQIYYSSNIVVF